MIADTIDYQKGMGEVLDQAIMFFQGERKDGWRFDAFIFEDDSGALVISSGESGDVYVLSKATLHMRDDVGFETKVHKN